MSETEVQTDRVWVPDRRWTTDPQIISRKLCRHMGAGRKVCRRPAAAAFARSNGWWGYCDDPEHLYGRRIRNGVVEVSVHQTSPAAERGFTR